MALTQNLDLKLRGLDEDWVNDERKRKSKMVAAVHVIKIQRIVLVLEQKFYKKNYAYLFILYNDYFFIYTLNNLYCDT